MVVVVAEAVVEVVVVVLVVVVVVVVVVAVRKMSECSGLVGSRAIGACNYVHKLITYV